MRNAKFFRNVLMSCLFLLVLTSVKAYDGIKLVPSSNQKTFTLYVGNLSAHELSVRITDQYAVSVFTQNVMATPNYAKRYNLSALPNGTYSVQVTTPTRIQTYSILITEDGRVATTEQVKIDYKPVVQLDGTKLDVNLLSQGKAVKLAILDKDNQLVYLLDLGNPAKIHQRLDLENLNMDEFILKIRCGERTFYENLSL
ncbi:MAG: hypothetical protein AAF990_03675 [Bacteroidota bacterium]